ncbi:B-type cyclin [Pichia kluyveri]|uniref:B-type cyclin n=1 Tax=Pichia kluyveri TaxID=36015 RepID=A0AAV5R008_PICKL|nr:B-type cyclin [Pichia kluyveri]
MLRRGSTRSQSQNTNDENNNQILRSKSSNNESNNIHRSNNNDSSSSNLSTQSSQSTNNNARARTVLGVVPESALNSFNQQHNNQNIHQQYNQNHHNIINNNNNNTSNNNVRNKIPVLIDNQSHDTITESPLTSSDVDDVMETSNINNDQENYIPETDYYNDYLVEEDEEDENEYEDDDLTTHTPLSPILTDSIRNEIDRVYSKFSRETLDPNDEDTYDVTMVAEYGNRIFNYLHSLEIKYKPNPRYIEEIQDDILWEHRATLIDWLVQLHSRFNLLPETLFLSVNIIDRFLSKNKISLSRFQLCGAVALFIAAKYEEIRVPTVSQMVYMVGNQFQRDAFLKAERFMVEVLGFEFGWPGPMSFLRRGSKADDYDNETRTLAKYFLEITIMDARFVKSPPSWLAAGAQFLSRKMLGKGDWTEAHVYYTGYTSEQLIPLAKVLEECCISAETHHKTIFQKYSERRYKRVACYVQQYLQEYYDL